MGPLLVDEKAFRNRKGGNSTAEGQGDERTRTNHALRRGGEPADVEKTSAKKSSRGAKKRHRAGIRASVGTLSADKAGFCKQTRPEKISRRTRPLHREQEASRTTTNDAIVSGKRERNCTRRDRNHMTPAVRCTKNRRHSCRNERVRRLALSSAGRTREHEPPAIGPRGIELERNLKGGSPLSTR